MELKLDGSEIEDSGAGRARIFRDGIGASAGAPFAGEKPLLLKRSAESGEADSSSGVPGLREMGNGNGRAAMASFSWDVLQEHGVELLFLATPHVVSRELVPEAIARGLRIVDLSGAWRLKQEEHRAVYGFKDANAAETAAELTASAVYGLPELKSNADSDSVGGAGCEPRLLCNFNHSCAGAACFRPALSIAIAASSPIRSPAYPAPARNRRRVLTSCPWPITFPPTRSSDTVIPAKSWSNWRSIPAS